MQDFQPTTSGQQFSSALKASNSLFTPKRVGFTLAGAFVLAGAVAATVQGVGGPAGNSGTAQTKNFTVQSTSTGNPAPNAGDQTSPSVSATTNFSANTDGSGKTNVHLNVNGQDIPVPQNGSSSQTITNGNGSTTTVDVNGNTSSQGETNNTSSSSFSVNVNSSSVSVGGSSTTSQ